MCQREFFERWLPNARIEIAHGQMGEGELESTMLSFSSERGRNSGVYHHHRIRSGYPPSQHDF